MADSVDKPLLGFLNGIARRTYFGETQFTDEFLREDVLGGMAEEGSYIHNHSQQTIITSPAVYAALLRRYEALLLNIVSADMDYTQLDAFLTSQKKKRQVNSRAVKWGYCSLAFSRIFTCPIGCPNSTRSGHCAEVLEESERQGL